MAHKWECRAGAWVISLFFSNSAFLFLISQFYRQAFVINPVNAQEGLLKAHIWPQLGCSIKTSPSSSLPTTAPAFGMSVSSLSCDPVTAAPSTGGRGTGRYAAPSGAPWRQGPRSKTHSSNTALPTVCPSSHHRGDSAGWLRSQEQQRYKGECPRNLQSHSLGVWEVCSSLGLPLL